MPVRSGRADFTNVSPERPPAYEPFRRVDPFGRWWSIHDRVYWRERGNPKLQSGFAAPGHPYVDARHFVRQDRVQFALSVDSTDWIGRTDDLSEETLLEQLRRARARGPVHIPLSVATTREAELEAYVRDYPGGVPRPMPWSGPNQRNST